MMPKANAAVSTIYEAISTLQPYPHEPIHSQRQYKLHVRKVDYKLLYSQKADTTTFVVLKSGPYKLL